MSISQDILDKYGVGDLDTYKSIYGDNDDTIRLFYQTFLDRTDHIPNKIVEELIEDLSSATALNFITIFINFIVKIRGEYKGILTCRKEARAEINNLAGGVIHNLLFQRRWIPCGYSPC